MALRFTLVTLAVGLALVLAQDQKTGHRPVTLPGQASYTDQARQTGFTGGQQGIDRSQFTKPYPPPGGTNQRPTGTGYIGTSGTQPNRGQYVKPYTPSHGTGQQPIGRGGPNRGQYTRPYPTPQPPGFQGTGANFGQHTRPYTSPQGTGFQGTGANRGQHTRPYTSPQGTGFQQPIGTADVNRGQYTKPYPPPQGTAFGQTQTRPPYQNPLLDTKPNQEQTAYKRTG